MNRDISGFIRSIRKKNIHIVGITGAEGSGILKFLDRHGAEKISVHDYIEESEIDRSFRLWHRGIGIEQRERDLSDFRKILSGTRKYFGKGYLTGIEYADIIFVPQSWRLYKDQNRKLFSLDTIKFVTITSLYLDYSKAKIIGVTGTVGKGSTANLIRSILKVSGKKVIFTGNDTWTKQEAEGIGQQKESDYLVLEISHRQLQGGINRIPDVMVYTNLYPNHLDEMSYEDYRNIKTSPLRKMAKGNIAVVNYDNKELRKSVSLAKYPVEFFSSAHQSVNRVNIVKILPRLLKLSGEGFFENIIAAATVADVLGIPAEDILKGIKEAGSLPGRFQAVGSLSGKKVIDDLKSTTPWATMKALDILGGKVVLICGGDLKGIDYSLFLKKLKDMKIEVMCLKSELSDFMEKRHTNIKVHDGLEEALKDSKESSFSETILISPAAAYFYSKFIRGKRTLRKIISLLQGGQE